MANGFDNNGEKKNDGVYMDSIDRANADRQRMLDEAAVEIDRQFKRQEMQKRTDEIIRRQINRRRYGSFMDPMESFDFWLENLPIVIGAAAGIAVGVWLGLSELSFPILAAVGFYLGAFVKYNAFQNYSVSEAFRRSLPHLIVAAAIILIFAVMLVAV